MRTPWVPLLVLVSAWTSALSVQAASAPGVNLMRSADRVRIEIGGQLFTEYVFTGAPKPYLYPVLASDGTEMMRHFPMKADVEGEIRDHPHHRSLWFTHGAVNGVDFWLERDLSKQGQVVNASVEHAVRDGVGEIRSRNRWAGPDGTVHLTDTTVIRVRGLADGSRLLDYEVTLQAPADKPVVLGDTKEGTMAIRLPLWMTPAHTYREGGQRVKHEGRGTIVNAEGIRNDDTWGKRSAWVDYHAPKNGKTYGVALFDHPKNPRHPSWWHVRSYALFAANPFGKHDFEPEHKANPKAGDLTIAAGQSVTFRWRFYFHQGDETAANVAARYQDFAATP